MPKAWMILQVVEPTRLGSQDTLRQKTEIGGFAKKNKLDLVGESHLGYLLTENPSLEEIARQARSADARVIVVTSIYRLCCTMDKIHEFREHLAQNGMGLIAIDGSHANLVSLDEPDGLLSYKKLWKLLIDKGMTKSQLRDLLGVSAATITKMGRGEPVKFETLIKICHTFDCDIGDIVSVPGTTTKGGNGNG